MLSLPASLARAFAQLADPRILWLLIKSLLVTLLLFVALGAVLYLGLMWLVDRGLGSVLDGLPPQTAELVAHQSRFPWSAPSWRRDRSNVRHRSAASNPTADPRPSGTGA